MKMTPLILTIAATLMMAVFPLNAKDKGKTKSRAATGDVVPGGQTAVKQADVAKDRKEPWLNVNVTIGSPEKEVIRTYVTTCVRPSKGKKAKGLPPGLAKKVQRGEELPPGWQKKCVRGEILPEHVYKHTHPLPHE